MSSKKYYVYIMSSLSGILYIGVTGHLENRVREHKEGALEGFTKKYHCHHLVYYEEFQYVDKALAREKQLKNWNRQKKMKIILTLNPNGRTWVRASAANRSLGCARDDKSVCMVRTIFLSFRPQRSEVEESISGAVFRFDRTHLPRIIDPSAALGMTKEEKRKIKLRTKE